MGGSDAKRSCHILAAANAGGVYPKSISPQDHHNWYLGKKKKNPTYLAWINISNVKVCFVQDLCPFPV